MEVNDIREFKMINFDDAAKDYRPGDIVGARNVRIGSTNDGEDGSAEVIKGNVKIPNPLLPFGVNTCIGSYEDKKNGSLFYFIHNDQSNHAIFRYYLEDDRIEKVLMFDFGWDKYSLITGIDYIDNLLYWTDNVCPRKVNVEKANDTNKLRGANIYFDNGNLTGGNYTLNIYGADGVLMTSVSTTISAQADLFSFCQEFYTQYIATATQPQLDILTVSTKGNYINTIFRAGYEGECRVEITSTNGSLLYVVPQNYYASPFSGKFIEAVKDPIPCEPATQYKNDPTKKVNYVRNKVFQFKTRLIYDDYEKSVTSPISNIAIDEEEVTDVVNTEKNYIEIDFYDDMFDVNRLSIVRKVELFFREHNTGLFRSIVTLELSDFLATGYKYNFYNNGNYSALDEATSNLLFHSVPLKTKSQKIVKNRLFYAGNTKGYNNVDIDAALTPVYKNAPSTSLYSITGNIYIQNRFASGAYSFYQPIHNMGAGIVFGGISSSSEEEDVGGDWGQTLPLGGFTVYLAGTPYRDVSVQVVGNNPGIQTNGVYDSTDNQWFGEGNLGLMKDDIEAGRVFSQFTISGVPPGTYILRLASHLTTADDLSSASRSYEKTSTFTSAVGGQAGYEYIVTITDSDITIGDTYVQDLSVPNLLDDGYGISGYLTDKDIEPAPSGAALLNDTRIEKALVTLSSEADLFTETRATTTDHNGFFFMSFSFSSFTTDAEMSLTSVVSSIYNLAPSVTDMSGASYNIGDIVRGESKMVILRSTNTDLQTKGRTTVVGSIANDATSRPVVGINTLVSGAGRLSKTDTDGKYSIVIYPEIDRSRDGYVVYNASNTNAIVTFSQPNVYFDIIINPTTPYNNAGPSYYLNINTLIATISGGLSQSTFKHGFDGQFGIVYYDDANRSTFVNTNNKLKQHIDFFSESTNNKGVVQIQWQIFNTPPSWATHYQWVRTKDQSVKTFIQFISKSVLYVDDTNTETPYANATKYKINFNNIVDYKTKNQNSKVSYTFTAGDRIRFIKYGSGAYLTTYIDQEVLDYSGGYLYVYKNTDLGSIEGGVLFEIYTPKAADEVITYYEFGECYKIGEDANGNKYHKKGAGAGATDQDPLDPIGVPATGTFKTGDVYFRIRTMPVTDGQRSEFVEDQAISDFYVSTDQSIGRPNIYNPDAKQETLPTEVMFSDVYIQDTKVNGFSSFQALNRKQLPNQYGFINKLILSGEDVLLALHENSKTVSMYINVALFKDVNGQQVVALADDVINSVTPLKENYGTQNAESHFESEVGYHYFVDRKKGSVARYTNNGLYAISLNKASTYFRKRLHDIGDGDLSKIKIPSSCDPGFYGYLVTMIGDDGTSFQNDTICYSEKNEGWCENYDFVPEYYGVVNKTLFTFKDGDIYKQNANETRCNFFGVQYKPMVRIMSNVNYAKVKVWESVSVNSNNKWYCQQAQTEENAMFGAGKMTTSMSLEKVRGKEGKYYMEFNRDTTSSGVTNPIVNGRKMRSQAIEVELTTDETGFTVLSAVGINATISEKS